MKTATSNIVDSGDTYYDMDELMEQEWELMQTETGIDVDNASIYRTAENTSDIVQLLLCANFLLVLILGCQLACIFSRYVRS